MLHKKKEREYCTVLHQLNNRLLGSQLAPTKKRIAGEYVAADILLLQEREHSKLILSVEGLKIVQSLCFLEIGRTYVASSEFYLPLICERLIELGTSYASSIHEESGSDFEEEQLCLILSILQKVSMHKQCFEKVVAEPTLVNYVVLNYLFHYKVLP